MDSTVHISEAGEEYNEKIEVDPNKRTELFHVPVDPGVDRIDTLHDFKRVSFSSLRYDFSSQFLNTMILASADKEWL